MKTVTSMARVSCPAIAALVVAVLQPSATAAAGDAADSAKRAEALLETHEPVAAYDAMEAAVDAFWREAPLIIKDAHFAPDTDASGFAPGVSVSIYFRPVGYGFEEIHGKFRVTLDTGIEIRSPGGLIFAKSNSFGRLEWTGPGKIRTYVGRISIDLPEVLKPGDYDLLLTVTDAASEKTASVTLPFAIAEE